MKFLAAEWRNLAIFNYEVPPEKLLPYLPSGTELDLYEGACYVSMVGFLFKNTRMLGIKVPYHLNFEEVNLRFYVKRKVDGSWRRGVVFIKEIVPKWALSFVANTLYKEHYVTQPMKHLWYEAGDMRHVSYQWQVAGSWQSLAITAAIEPKDIPEGSMAEFITEHYWGYSRVSEKRTNEYQVRHPRWDQYPVMGYETHFDFELNYGNHFAFLNGEQPHSVHLAVGSEISVDSKKTLR
ncbi:MAG: DUF2071 domain-containing protein [Bacteroidota bacterium]